MNITIDDMEKSEKKRNDQEWNVWPKTLGTSGTIGSLTTFQIP